MPLLHCLGSTKAASDIKSIGSSQIKTIISDWLLAAELTKYSTTYMQVRSLF
jgi:hypothetical protein